MAGEKLFDIAREKKPRRLPPEGWESEVRPTNGEALRIVVDDAQVHEVLSTLTHTYRENLFPYNLDSVRLPHDPRHMPNSLERGGKDHAMFLWNVCYYMRGGIKSVDAVKKMSRVYDEQPGVFRCEVAAALDKPEIAALLKKHGLGFQERVAEEWIGNAQRLLERFEGDPRNIFNGVDSYETCLGHIQNKGKGQGFVGFQEKMVSMITYYLMDEGLIEPFVFPIPVDLHVMRISIANEMITFPDAPYGTNLCTDETLAMLRKIYYDYAVEHGLDPLLLCNAVWSLSESFCGLHPGNRTLEPHGRKNRNGRSTYLLPAPVNEEDISQRMTYQATCARCPVENSCEYTVPGKHYYVGGSVIIRGKRLRFPPLATVFDTGNDVT